MAKVKIAPVFVVDEHAPPTFSVWVPYARCRGF